MIDLADFQDGRLLVITGAAFVLVLTLWIMFVVIWSSRRSSEREQLSNRLSFEQSNSDARVLRLWKEGEEVTASAPTRVDRLSWAQRAKRMPEQAGWSIPFHSLLLAVAGLAGFVALAGYLLTSSIVVAAGLAAIVIASVWLFMQYSIGKRMALFETQLVDALEIVARSLRAGHPVLGAFQLVADEMEDPIRQPFQEICQQQALGVSLESAIQEAGEESLSRDFRMFTASIGIALRSGGNLADMMDRMAYVIRARIRLGQRVRVLTSQAKFSKNVLIALPFVIGALLLMINGDYVQMLFTTEIGRLLIASGLCSIGFGAFVMNRMVKISY